MAQSDIIAFGMISREEAERYQRCYWVGVPELEIMLDFFYILWYYHQVGALAQLGARHTGSVEVTGSNPVCSIFYYTKINLRDIDTHS